MEKSILEKRIIQKAKDRFEEDVRKAGVEISKNPILSVLRFNGSNLKLGNSGMGYCPSTDLFNASPDRGLLCTHTNFKVIESDLISEYVAEETDKILSQLALLQEYISE